MTLAAIVAGIVEPVAGGARLQVVGGITLDLPWWPTESEVSALTPGYTDTDRPGRTPLGTRSSEPLPTRRLTFTVSGRDYTESAERWLSQVEAIAKAKPLVRLVLGARDLGVWQVRDAGYTEVDWTDTGDASEAEVTIELRRAAGPVDPVGPIKRRPKR